MWKTIVKQANRLLYYFGKTPPSSAEVAAELDRLQQTQAGGTDAKAVGDRCDCLVTAGGTQIGCYPNITVAACNLIGDTKPGLNGTPYPLGSCRNMPK
jgi:hypothetical protein